MILTSLRKCLLVITGATSLTAMAAKDGLPADVAKQLAAYNVVWNAPSTNGSLSSMPIGNGDLTANVWVEQNGDLMFYIGKADTWSEATRLLKVGRVRVKMSPNPFVAGKPFREELDLRNGELRINAGSKGESVRLRLWIDANNPVVRVEAESDKPVTVTATTELMRPTPFTLTNNDHPLASSFRGVTDGPVRPSESADKLEKKQDAVCWYHRNETSLYPLILKHQNVAELANKYPDPYMHRTFGAVMKGAGMKVENDSVLTSASAMRKHTLNIYALTEQTNTASEWSKNIDNLVASVEKTPMAKAKVSHQGWWNQFWNRSWIFLSGDNDAERVTRAYLLQRYMMACQSRGAYPTKFNGGTLTFDNQGRNGDYRNWGPGYWYQNCRLYYWPLSGSGDIDLKKPWFDMYMNMLPMQRDITRAYYGHDGAFFPETLNFFGLYIQDDWGWNNTGKASQTRWIRYHYEGALEMLAEMIDAYKYTRDEQFARNYVVPFATQVIRFFANHWPTINNTYRFIPANSLEQFWDCLNPTDYIAGLTADINWLKELPASIVDDKLMKEWNDCLASLPAIAMADHGKRILPAEEYGQGRNFENPELYTIFPFRLYGVGKPNIEVAKNTFDKRVFNQPTCWSQDAIQAALLGMGDVAKDCILRNVGQTAPDVPFPVFWKQMSDYIPDLDNGGVMTIALQYMLLQNVDDKVYVLPAMPKEWSVDFKLHAHNNTTVRVKGKGGKVASIDVAPLSRKADVVFGAE